MHLQYTALLGLLSLFLFCGAASPSHLAPASLVFPPPLRDTHYYIESSAPKNWFEALAACQQIGYQLVSLQTEEKFKTLVDILISSPRQSLLYWTSGNDLYTLGRHHWYPGNETILDSLWGPNQPDNFGGLQNCDELARNINGYDLRDDNCYLPRNYICELADDSTTTAAPDTSDETTTTASSDSSDETTTSAPSDSFDSSGSSSDSSSESSSDSSDPDST